MREIEAEKKMTPAESHSQSDAENVDVKKKIRKIKRRSDSSQQTYDLEITAGIEYRGNLE